MKYICGFCEFCYGLFRDYRDCRRVAQHPSELPRLADLIPPS